MRSLQIKNTEYLSRVCVCVCVCVCETCMQTDLKLASHVDPLYPSI